MADSNGINSNKETEKEKKEREAKAEEKRKMEIAKAPDVINKLMGELVDTEKSFLDSLRLFNPPAVILNTKKLMSSKLKYPALNAFNKHAKEVVNSGEEVLKLLSISILNLNNSDFNLAEHQKLLKEAMDVHAENITKTALEYEAAMKEIGQLKKDYPQDGKVQTEVTKFLHGHVIPAIEAKPANEVLGTPEVLEKPEIVVPQATSLAITPVQRLPRYKMLSDEMDKQAAKASLTNPFLSSSDLDAYAKNFNTRQAQQQAQKALKGLNLKDPKNETLVSKEIERAINEGYLEKIGLSTEETTETLIYLNLRVLDPSLKNSLLDNFNIRNKENVLTIALSKADLKNPVKVIEAFKVMTKLQQKSVNVQGSPAFNQALLRPEIASKIKNLSSIDEDKKISAASEKDTIKIPEAQLQQATPIETSNPLRMKLPADFSPTQVVTSTQSTSADASSLENSAVRMVLPPEKPTPIAVRPAILQKQQAFRASTLADALIELKSVEGKSSRFKGDEFKANKAKIIKNAVSVINETIKTKENTLGQVKPQELMDALIYLDKKGKLGDINPGSITLEKASVGGNQTPQSKEELPKLIARIGVVEKLISKGFDFPGINDFVLEIDLNRKALEDAGVHKSKLIKLDVAATGSDYVAADYGKVFSLLKDLKTKEGAKNSASTVDTAIFSINHAIKNGFLEKLNHQELKTAVTILSDKGKHESLSIYEVNLPPKGQSNAPTVLDQLSDAVRLTNAGISVVYGDDFKKRAAEGVLASQEVISDSNERAAVNQLIATWQSEKKVLEDKAKTVTPKAAAPTSSIGQTTAASMSTASLVGGGSPRKPVVPTPKAPIAARSPSSIPTNKVVLPGSMPKPRTTPTGSPTPAGLSGAQKPPVVNAVTTPTAALPSAAGIPKPPANPAPKRQTTTTTSSITPTASAPLPGRGAPPAKPLTNTTGVTPASPQTSAGSKIPYATRGAASASPSKFLTNSTGVTPVASLPTAGIKPPLPVSSRGVPSSTNTELSSLQLPTGVTSPLKEGEFNTLQDFGNRTLSSQKERSTISYRLSPSSGLQFKDTTQPIYAKVAEDTFKNIRESSSPNQQVIITPGASLNDTARADLISALKSEAMKPENEKISIQIKVGTETKALIGKPPTAPQNSGIPRRSGH